MRNAVRSFIAIELPAEFKAELTSVEDKLKAGHHPFVKWVNPSGIHLTLKFLGNIAPEKITGITYVLTEVASVIPPFQLGLGKLGAFPNLRRPRVIWVAITGDVERLAILNREVESALDSLGFPRESRPFSPHLTLARLRERTSSIEREELGKFTASTPFQSKLIFEVNTISLMKSELNPRGAVYHRLASIALGLDSPESPSPLT